jgi:hypothetical protein
MNSNGDVISVPSGEEPPAGAVPISDGAVATELRGLNRRGRLAFYSERRRGASEGEALAAARRAHVR